MHSLHSSADPTARDVSMNEAFSKYVVLLVAICALQQYAASFSHTHTHTVLEKRYHYKYPVTVCTAPLHHLLKFKYDGRKFTFKSLDIIAFLSGISADEIE